VEVIEKAITYRRPDVFKIYPIGDCHLGTVHCAETKLKAKLTEIAQDKNAYIIGMGDYADSITERDPRWNSQEIAEWVERDNIIECERKRVITLFKPVKDKIITLLTGNHEETIHKHHNNNFTKNICEDLGVPYGGYSCFIRLYFRRSSKASRQYTFHCWHGAGSAQTEGARLMRLKRLVKEMVADCYLMGHLHTITHDITDRLALRNHKIKAIPQIATITGSWLKTYTQGSSISYAEMAGYKPSHIGCPVILIEPDADKLSYLSD
jgi:predicted phosphodiesterase